MNTSKFVTASIAAFMLASTISTAATAAPIEITASTKSSLDKTIAKSDRAQADQISSLYNEFIALQKDEQEWDVKIKALYTENQKTSSALSKQIKQIDNINLDQLEAELKQTQERYKPLFAHYTSLNKQIAEAKDLKNKDLSSMLRLQANTLKIPVQFARFDIKTKENTWRTAKDNAAKKMNEIRGTLAGRDPINSQIKTSKSAIKTAETQENQVLNAFKEAAKKGDASGILDTLASLVSLSRQINKEKQTVFNLESKISSILSAAKAQMP